MTSKIVNLGFDSLKIIFPYSKIS